MGERMRARSFIKPFTRVCVCVTGKIENALACARLMFLLPGDRGFAFLGRRPLQPHLPSNREFFPAQDFDFNHQFFKKKIKPFIPYDRTPKIDSWRHPQRRRTQA
jgi:hypothetical protein